MKKEKLRTVDLTEHQITEYYTFSVEYDIVGQAMGETFRLSDILDADDMQTMTVADLYETRARYVVEEIVQNGYYEEEDIYQDRAAWTDDEWTVRAVDIDLYIDLGGKTYRLKCNNNYLTDAEITEGGEQ